MAASLLHGLAWPFVLLVLNLMFLPPALLITALKLDPSLQNLRHRWFALFWKFYGAQSSAAGAPSVSKIMPAARGVVLDIGTGAGHFLRLYDPANIERLVCVEPNEGHHAGLRKRAEAAGFAGKYEVVGEFVQDLAGKVPGIDEGAVDTVITLQVLCSVPTPRDVCRELYKLLRPGGTWIVYEHVRSRSGARPVVFAQWMLNLVWPGIFGGCNLCRDTVEMLNGIGSWKVCAVKAVSEDHEVIPHVAGIMVKDDGKT